MKVLVGKVVVIGDMGGVKRLVLKLGVKMWGWSNMVAIEKNVLSTQKPFCPNSFVNNSKNIKLIAGVGKTSLVNRYTEKSFLEASPPTIGASFVACKVPIDDITVKMQIWDTAGQERYKAVTTLYYRNANAALLVFDVTNVESFENLKCWARELRRHNDSAMDLCVIGNKSDLTVQKMVTRVEGIQYANSIGASYFECSAKEDQGIDQIFTKIAYDLVKQMLDASSSSTMKMYEGDTESALMASSTQLKATDVGWIEEPGGSISSIAHGEPCKASKCC